MIKKNLEQFQIKLFLSYFVIILLMLGLLWAATWWTAPPAFNRHMGGGEGMMMGDSTGRMEGVGPARNLPQNRTLAEDSFNNFRRSMNEILIWSGVFAVVVAVFVSYFLSRGVVAPLRAMSAASLRIADGHYDERLEIVGGDEVAQVGVHFNRMAQALEQVEERRRRLIGDVAHELRTPLTTIKGSVEGLLDGVLPANPDTFHLIQHESERLTRLVDDLQELSRVEAGEYSLDIQPTNIKRLTGLAAKRLAQQFEKKSVALVIHGVEENFHVLADENRLIQILTNLLNNALQHTPSGGRVEIETHDQGTMLQIAVRDNGAGIAAEHIEHIFERFYRVEKSRSRLAGGGSGIGLTIAKHLVEAQGGKIWAESRGLGDGSSFIFQLPKG